MAVLLAGLGACVTLPEDSPWILAESEHFQIYSQVSAAETTELAEKLETFREVTRLITNAGEGAFRPVVPTIVHVFRSSGGYDEFAPARSAGYIVPQQRANYIALNASARGIDPERIIYHEFVHYLLRNGATGASPRWVDEGMAEYLAGTDIEAEHVTLAVPAKHRFATFRLRPHLPMKRLFTASNTSDWLALDEAMLYAQSWALVHYLYAGSAVGMPDRRGQLTRYLELLGDGLATEEAFTQAFETTFDDLGNELRRYVEQGKFQMMRIDRSQFPTPRAASVRSVPRHEIARQLGELALLKGAYARAQRLFEASLEDEPRGARSLAGLARARVAQGQGTFEEIRRLFARAIELDPEDALNHLDLAQYLLSLASANADHPDFGDLTQNSRDAFARAIALAPELPEAYAQAAKLYRLPNQSWSKGMPLIEAAYALLPSDLEILITLAEYRILDGQYDSAERLLNTSAMWAGESGGDAIQAIALVRKRLDDARAQGGASATTPPNLDTPQAR